ncbi:hypothetical protein BH11GEM2_BH11GEM2_35520 [soil metagenome]
MGAEAKTTLTLGRQILAGTAHLETSELRFRDDRGLHIPLPQVEKLVIPVSAR